MQYRVLLLIATLAGLMSDSLSAATFFSDDFESYTLDGDVAGSGNWTIFNTAATIENEGQWHLVDTKNTAGYFLLPSTVNFGPATVGGATTPPYDPTGAAPGGLYMLSSTGGVPPGLFPSYPSGTTPTDPDLPDDDGRNEERVGPEHPCDRVE